MLFETLHPRAGVCERGKTYGEYAGEAKMWVTPRCSGRFSCAGWPVFCGSWLQHGSRDRVRPRPVTNCTCGAGNASTAPKAPLRVAHMIVGQLRGFLDPRVLHSLRHDVIEAAGGEPEAFLLLKPHHGVNRTVVAEKVRALGVFATLRLRPNASDVAARTRCTNLISYEHHFAAASWDRSEAFRMVLARERERSEPFDVFVRLRPDEYFCDPFPRLDTIDWRVYGSTLVAFQAQHVPGLQDHAALMTRAVAGVYFDSYRAFDVCRTTSGLMPRARYSGCMGFHAATNFSKKAAPAECLQLSWLEDMGVRHDNGRVLGPIRACLVDGNNNFRRCTGKREMAYVWTKTHFWAESIEKCGRRSVSTGQLSEEDRLAFGNSTKRMFH
jgi:hypothetical protein